MIMIMVVKYLITRLQVVQAGEQMLKVEKGTGQPRVLGRGPIETGQIISGLFPLFIKYKIKCTVWSHVPYLQLYNYTI